MNRNEPSGYDSNPPSSRPESPYPASPRPTGVILRSPERKPVVTYAILAITVVVFILQILSENILGQDLPFVLGAKVNQLILAGQWWRLITPILLHGSILHIGFNMYALYIFGPGLERQNGHIRFLILYLLAGFAGNVASFIFSDSIAVGSSTSVFGLIGAQAVLVFQNRRLYGDRFRPIINNTLAIVAINLLFGFTTRNIDNWGHIGGLIGGSLFALLAGPVWEVEGIHPDYHLVDRRGPVQVILAAVAVAVFFGVALFLGANAQLAGL